MITAQGQRGTSAALGYVHEMNPSPFSPLAAPDCGPARPKGKKEKLDRGGFTQGGGLDVLALGYYYAAPDGAPERSRPVGCLLGDLFTSGECDPKRRLGWSGDRALATGEAHMDSSCRCFRPLGLPTCS